MRHIPKNFASLTLIPIIAFFVLGPLLFLVWKVISGVDPEILGEMEALGVPFVIGQVALLASLATAWALLLGTPFAWLTVRSDLPLRSLFRWLAPLPLAVPPYIGAFTYQVLLAPGGLLASWTGSPTLPVSIYGVGGAAFVLGLFTYPYIYLLVGGALERTNPLLEEAARSAGLGSWAIFWRVSLPLLRPALFAGGLMVFLYGWADFGVVSLLRVRTLTTLIYDYVQGTMGWGLPAGLSLLLSAITIGVLFAQIKILGRARYSQIVSGARPPRPVPLKGWRWPAFFYALLVLGLAFLLPLLLLVHQVLRLGGGEILSFLSSQGRFFVNSLWTALVGASLALLIALVVSWLESRRAGWGLPALFQVGYAIPGTVLGLGMAGFLHALTPWIYASPLIIVIGYLVLFLTPACQATKSALAQLTPSIEEASRSLGRGPVHTFLKVTLPLVRPGLIGGWILVFVLSMRELAATLIVRPPGFDTLPVRIWIHTMDVGPEPRAALLALALVLTIALPWLALLSLRPRGVSAG